MRGWGTGAPALSRALYPQAPFGSALLLWLSAPLALSTLPGLPVENGKELKPFLGSPSGVIRAGLLLPTSSLGWEDQREHVDCCRLPCLRLSEG